MPPCPWFTDRKDRKPTGHIRFREGWSGVVLQIEWSWRQASYQYRRPTDGEYERKTGWEDADPFDLSRPELRWLIDGPEAVAAGIGAK